MTTNDFEGFGIDAERESMLTFSAAARYVGKLKGGKPVSLQTLWRWATKGSHGVRLESLCVGGTRCTSKEALQLYFDSLTLAKACAGVAGSSPGDAAAPVREVIGDVDAVLRRAGIIGGPEGVGP